MFLINKHVRVISLGKQAVSISMHVPQVMGLAFVKEMFLERIVIPAYPDFGICRIMETDVNLVTAILMDHMTRSVRPPLANVGRFPYISSTVKLINSGNC